MRGRGMRLRLFMRLVLLCEGYGDQDVEEGKGKVACVDQWLVEFVLRTVKLA